VYRREEPTTPYVFLQGEDSVYRMSVAQLYLAFLFSVGGATTYISQEVQKVPSHVSADTTFAEGRLKRSRQSGGQCQPRGRAAHAAHFGFSRGKVTTFSSRNIDDFST